MVPYSAIHHNWACKSETTLRFYCHKKWQVHINLYKVNYDANAICNTFLVDHLHKIHNDINVCGCNVKKDYCVKGLANLWHLFVLWDFSLFHTCAIKSENNRQFILLCYGVNEHKEVTLHTKSTTVLFHSRHLSNQNTLLVRVGINGLK